MAQRDGQFDASLLNDPAKFADFIRKSRYISSYFATRIIRRWSSHYPSDRQFRVILFDDIVHRPDETVREILTFLGAKHSKGGTVPTDYNRKFADKKIEMPECIRKILAEYFDEEVGACSKMLGGATRAWPTAPPATRCWWSFKRRVLRLFFGSKEFLESVIKSLFTATRWWRSASHRLLTRNWRRFLSRAARQGRAINRRKRQIIANSRGVVRALVRPVTAGIPIAELLIDAKSFAANELIRDCSAFLKDVLHLPQRRLGRH